MEKNKYQDALNLIRNDCNGGRPKLTQTEGNKLLDTLQELINEYELTDAAYNCRLHDFEIYKKALDKACALLAKWQPHSAYDKDYWKEWLLKDENR